MYEWNKKSKCSNSSAWATNSCSSFHNQSASHTGDVWVSYVRPTEREKSWSRRSLREGERERDRDKSGPSILWPSTGAQHTPLTLIASISIPGSPATPRTLGHFPTFSDQNTGTEGLLSGFKVDLTPPYFIDMGDMGDPPKSKLCFNVYMCVSWHLLLILAIYFQPYVSMPIILYDFSSLFRVLQKLNSS